MKMQSSDVVKVNITVTNSMGDVAYDIYEFYMTDAPFAGSMTISLVGEAYNSTGYSVDSLL